MNAKKLFVCLMAMCILAAMPCFAGETNREKKAQENLIESHIVHFKVCVIEKKIKQCRKKIRALQNHLLNLQRYYSEKDSDYFAFQEAKIVRRIEKVQEREEMLQTIKFALDFIQLKRAE